MSARELFPVYPTLSFIVYGHTTAYISSYA